ncbi:MAG: polyprenyl synthetase family protein [Burkholderiales bacterium]|jgi:geranylgeranyl diphosphate synthase type II|nr:polyprenyl synthetase family protein [Burkholderiales bacterium]MCA3216029.1 polyprenyl synthetase family protein [Burkholderiales bacterium]
MDFKTRIERALERALALADDHTPPKLVAALRHAVFPGGARIRPQLCLAVAGACGDDDPALAEAAAAAIELLHCASLVHDDLPCFDDAATRRGRPSVHKAYGERLAVLGGDALIVLSFQVLALAAAGHPRRLSPLVCSIGASAGLPVGIVAGQAWECEPRVALLEYQRQKTGSLFVAATVAGAQAAGSDPTPWRRLGEALGEAYQIADDIRDVAADPARLGKPVGQDKALGRPNACAELGFGPAVRYFDRLMDEAVAAIPECPGAEQFRALVQAESARLVPAELARLAA